MRCAATTPMPWPSAVRGRSPQPNAAARPTSRRHGSAATLTRLLDNERLTTRLPGISQFIRRIADVRGKRWRKSWAGSAPNPRPAPHESPCPTASTWAPASEASVGFRRATEQKNTIMCLIADIRARRVARPPQPAARPLRGGDRPGHYQFLWWPRWARHVTASRAVSAKLLPDAEGHAVLMPSAVRYLPGWQSHHRPRAAWLSSARRPVANHRACP